ncbi:MAG: hypothetical protein LQ343_003395 [Gyalolechia ehrenbergii]|nr:MAG: hypothetical protein LQ343_003395 [Gyalolechia ehrenbergii]
MLLPNACLLTTLILPLLPAATASPNGGGPPKLKSPPVLTPRPLNVTTITANAQRESVLQCWSVANLSVSNEPGVQGALVANLLPAPSAVNLFDIPAKFDGGLHNAPVVQYVFFASGTAVISLPNSTTTATFGANGLILATDTKNVSILGHTTTYPSREQTVGLVIRVKGNVAPEHVVLHEGPCGREELNLER